MPFQSNPNAGGFDSTILSLLFAERDKRRAAERQAMLDQAKAQQDALKFAMEQAKAEREEQRAAEKHRIDMLKSRADLASSMMSTIAPQVDAARRTAEDVTSANFTEADLFEDGGGDDFASLIQALDPSAAGQVQQSNEAISNFRAQTGAATDIMQALNPGLSQRQAFDASLGAGGAFEAGRARAASIEEQRVIRQEARGEARARREVLLADSLRDQNIISDSAGKALGALKAVDTLQQSRNELRRTASRLRAAGEDVSNIEEKISVIDGQIRAIRDPKTVRNVSPIPFESKSKLVNDFRAADMTLSSVEELFNAFQSGGIVGGLTGKLTNFRAVASNLLSQALGDTTPINEQGETFADTEVGKMLQSIRLPDGSIPIDLPKQLTLGLEQVALAYAFSRMGRGNARFTIKEMSEISKQIGLTSLTATPDSIQGALVKVAEAAMREKTTAFFLLGDDPEFRDQLGALQNIPADQALIERMKNENIRPGFPGRTNKTGRNGAQGGPLIDPRTVRDSELLEMFPRGGAQ